MAIWSFCAWAALLASGCTTDRERVPGEPVQISMWMFGGVEEQDRWLRQAVNRFNAAQDNIRVDYENRDWATQRESLITSTIAGEGPDIIRVHHKYSVEFGELGGLYALEQFADFPKSKRGFSTICGSTSRTEASTLGCPSRFCLLSWQ